MVNKDIVVWEHVYFNGKEIVTINEQEAKEIQWAFVTPASYQNKTVYYFTNKEDMLPWLRLQGLLGIYEDAEERRIGALKFMASDEYTKNEDKIHKVQNHNIKGMAHKIMKILEELGIEPSDPDLFEKVKKAQNPFTGNILHTCVCFALENLTNTSSGNIPDPQPLFIFNGMMINDLSNIGNGNWLCHISSAQVGSRALILYDGKDFAGMQRFLIGGVHYILGKDIMGRTWNDRAQSLQELQQI